MTGNQNNFSPTPFDTRGRNVTGCSANIVLPSLEYIPCYWNVVCLLHTIYMQTVVPNTHEQNLSLYACSLNCYASRTKPVNVFLMSSSEKLAANALLP